jgi:hypothetical protein
MMTVKSGIRRILMNRRNPVVVLLLLLLMASGCSVDTELGGVRVPNSKPDTQITGQPPTLLEAGFSVAFNWTGSDNDGMIKGYQWKISDNGMDGISARDTLTFDPLTGAELNPWYFTTATDTIFFVLADQAGFPGDSELPDEDQQRSFRTHTLFVRAVDENDAVDPSPDMISFTSTTLVPEIQVLFPSLNSNSTEPKSAPQSVNVSWIGADEDFDLRVPTKVRYLWKPSVLDDGVTIIGGKYEYDANVEELVGFDDPLWGEWVSYSGPNGERLASFPHQTDPPGLWLFAVQAQDTAGAISVGRGYQTQVAHFRISSQFTPLVTLTEGTLGQMSGSTEYSSIASGRPLNFSWTADCTSYNGNVISMRHGWDITDLNNADDDGWSVQPGLSEQNKYSVETSFQTGFHVFTVQVVDDSNNTTTLEWNLEVIPYVDYTRQRNLLFLDQYNDSNRNTWRNPYSQISYGDEYYRNGYWSFLHTAEAGNSGPPGTVFEFFEDRDWSNHDDPGVDYAKIVRYKAVLCITYYSDSQSIFRNDFRPQGGQDPFVWLTPYQARGGNLFLVGERSMESFLENLSYMVPIIYDTNEFVKAMDGKTYYIGFGMKRLRDGTQVPRGPLQYPYATAGIAALDWMAPNSYYNYDRSETVNYDRKPGCVAMKGLVLDSDFKSNHLIGPGVIADTMLTDPNIDYYDSSYPIDNRWLFVPQNTDFKYDEFYNANLSTRNTSMSPQVGCVDGVNGECIEPMFRSLARFDWLREEKREAGYDNWPDGYYFGSMMRDTCGEFSLNSYEGLPDASARTNNQIVGFLSYKMTESKPSRKADVYWGFDPYRFEPTETKKAVRWVLQYFGLQINN